MESEQQKHLLFLAQALA